MVCGEIVDPVILEGRQLGRVGYFQNNLMRRCTMKRFGLVLLVFIFAITLGGCASMQEWCGPHKKAEAPPPVQVAQKAPEPVKQAPPPPPPKKDRN